MDSKDAELAIGLLASPNEQHTTHQQVGLVRTRQEGGSRYVGFLIIQLFLLTVYTGIFFTLRCPSPNCSITANLAGFRPAQVGLPMAPKLFEKNGHFVSQFSRPPGPATDAAWARLLEGGNMRVSQSELSEYANATSVQVLQPLSSTGEPQYLAKMGFYHDLHCLHKMKRWLYPEAYLAGASEAHVNEERTHLEHCIEWIRTAALCRGDTTLTLFEWIDGQLKTKYPIPHQCVDEDALLSWSRREGRMVDIDIAGAIEGPSAPFNQ